MEGGEKDEVAKDGRKCMFLTIYTPSTFAQLLSWAWLRFARTRLGLQCSRQRPQRQRAGLRCRTLSNGSILLVAHRS